MTDLGPPEAGLLGEKCEEGEFCQLQSKEAATHLAHGEAQPWQKSGNVNEEEELQGWKKKIQVRTGASAS